MKSQLHNTREPHAAVVTQRTRLTVLRNTRRAGPLGLPEIIALGVATLLLFAALAAYFFYLVPQRQRLVALGQEREQLEKRLHDANQVEQQHKDTNTIIADILASLDKFETGTLAERDARRRERPRARATRQPAPRHVGLFPPRRREHGRHNRQRRRHITVSGGRI